MQWCDWPFSVNLCVSLLSCFRWPITTSTRTTRRWSIPTSRAGAASSRPLCSLVCSTSWSASCVGLWSPRRRYKKPKSCTKLTSVRMSSTRKAGIIFWRWVILFALSRLTGMKMFSCWFTAQYHRHLYNQQINQPASQPANPRTNQPKTQAEINSKLSYVLEC